MNISQKMSVVLRRIVNYRLALILCGFFWTLSLKSYSPLQGDSGIIDYLSSQLLILFGVLLGDHLLDFPTLANHLRERRPVVASVLAYGSLVTVVLLLLLSFVLKP